MPDGIVLISPDPVDGYPPVRNQARLLADAGHPVTLLTAPLAPDGRVRFAHDGVSVHTLPRRAGRLGAVQRFCDGVGAVTALRRRSPAPSTEIAFGPLAVAYSDFAPGRPRRRIAHFHETLQGLDKHRVERRLRTALRAYERIVVPDRDRATLLRDQLGLRSLPMVVPNYPLRSRAPWRPAQDRETFEVIYAGSIGRHQRIDVLLESVVHWPRHATLTIVGADGTAFAGQMKDRVRALCLHERVRFTGWLDYDRLEARLTEADLGILLLDGHFEQWRTASGASNKRYQYMQAGLPQIGDDNPGIRELLEGNAIGTCVQAHTTGAVTAAVRAYADDPGRRWREGARAVELHRTRFHYEAAFAPVLDWLRTAPRGR